MKITKVKILFMSPVDGSVSERPDAHYTPVIPITIWPSDTDNPLTYKPKGLQEKVYALLDTGADLCYVEESLAGRLNLPIQSETTVSGATSTIKTTSRNAIIDFTEGKKAFAVELTVLPLVDNSRKYHVVLGMELIKRSSLVMDFRNNIYELTFHIQDADVSSPAGQ